MERHSSIKVRETGKTMKVRITSAVAPEIDDRVIAKWQKWLDLVARLAHIPAALIMKLNEDTIEVFLKSNSTGNPYKRNEKTNLGCGLFCENVIGTRRKLLISDASTNIDWKINNPDIDLNMISYLGYPINWPDGEIFGTICILDNKENQFSKDLDELLFNLKQNIESDLELLLSKQTLSESEEKFRLLFNFLPHPVAFTDYATGRILEFNDKLLEITGFTKNDILNKTTVGLGFIDQSARDKIVAEIHDKGNAEGIEISFPTPAHGLMHFLLFSAKIKLKGEEKLITTLLNITENKRHMETLQQSEKQLRELNATKNKFFSIIGHDLMDPFNALLGFNQLLIEALKNEENTDSLEYANYIQQSAQRIINLLQSLLIWTRTQSGNFNYTPHLVTIEELVSDAVKILTPNARIKRIELLTEIGKDTKAMLDYNMISTVIRNLVMNAIKFTGEGGTITIKANCRNNRLHVTVSDTGIGIEKKYLNQLFTLDKSISANILNDERGSGLGLIICNEFITFHNGKIWAESTPGKGSDFHFWIPLNSGKVENKK